MARTKQIINLLLLMLTIIVGIFSYILNLGWIRLLLCLLFLIYNIGMLTIGILYIFKSKMEKPINTIAFYIGLVTYLLFNVFLIDGGDIGTPYCFFGLIKIHGNGYLFSYISGISLIISLVCTVLNITATVNKRAM